MSTFHSGVAFRHFGVDPLPRGICQRLDRLHVESSLLDLRVELFSMVPFCLLYLATEFLLCHRNTVMEPLPSNGRFLLLWYFDPQASCHNNAEEGYLYFMKFYYVLPLFEERTPFPSIWTVLKRRLIRSWVPTGPEAKKDFVGENQLQFIDLNWMKLCNVFMKQYFAMVNTSP
jgi:hypothetical protein